MFLKSYFYLMMMMIFLLIFNLNKYFLMFLICMEFFVVFNLCMMLMSMFLIEMSEWLFMYYLIISVCDSVFGLSILVSMMKLISDEGLMKMNFKS